MTTRVLPCGPVTAVETIEGGLLLRCQNLLLRVLVRNQHVVRVTYTYNQDFNDFSYAVDEPVLAQTPEAGHWASEVTDQFVKINTPCMVVLIDRADARVTITDANGHVINQDETGLGVSLIGADLTAYKTLMPGEHFLGLGEKTGHLDKARKAFTMWNTDFFGYDLESDPIYCSIPFYIGVHSGLVYGLFLDNSHRTNFNFGASNDRFSSFSTTGGDLNYYFISADSIPQIVSCYTELTGRMPMPPKWSLGLQQCRYSYYPDWRVTTLAQTYRNRQIPCDVLYLDIHYMDNYKIFTWHPDRFAKPKEFLDELKEMGFKVVVIVDPGIKKEPGYDAYEEGLKQEVFLKYPDGQPYTAQVWPGWCHFPDFSKPQARQWWGNHFKGYVNDGIAGFWTDMNEIASWGQSTPDNVLFDFEGHGTTHREGRNIYGMQMARATLQGTEAHMDNQRSFVLTRAGYAGVQRYAAVWTGDNTASTAHMMLGVRMVLNMGLSGLAFSGVDIGGFIGECSKDLFARWVSIGTFSPLFRIHKMIDERESDPWSYGERIEAICKNYINLRYRLLPHLYCLFHEAAQTGMPVVRPMAMYYPHEERCYYENYEQQYFFGSNVLVAPCPEYDPYTKVMLPGEGEWYELFTDRLLPASQEYLMESPVEKLPVFVRGGSFLLMQSLVQNTAEKPEPELHLHLYHGYHPFTMTWYEDDGESLNYQKGQSLSRQISHQPGLHSLQFSQTLGEFASTFSRLKIYFHGFDNLHSVKAHGQELQVQPELCQWLNPTPQFDPLGMSSLGYGVQVQTVVVDLPGTPFTVSY